MGRLEYKVALASRGGLFNTLSYKALAFIILAVAGVASAASTFTADANTESAGASSAIIGRYLQATEQKGHVLPESSMEVEINASIPKLQQNGRLHALRVISQVGRISYRVLGFQGSNTVKSQVIARYLQAEQQGQGDPRLAVTPVNYKFKMKGERITDEGKWVYVFALTPRGSATGLFKGEIWLDQDTCLPVFEKGRLAKNPSIFFKKVDFERAFAIQNGQAVPQHTNSVIMTRLVGKVQLDVSYSNYAQIVDGQVGGRSTNLKDISSRQ